MTLPCWADTGGDSWVEVPWGARRPSVDPDRCTTHKGVGTDDSARVVTYVYPVVSLQRIYDGKGSRRLVCNYDISSVNLPARI